jgi:hypothetical protein
MHAFLNDEALYSLQNHISDKTEAIIYAIEDPKNKVIYTRIVLPKMRIIIVVSNSSALAFPELIK